MSVLAQLYTEFLNYCAKFIVPEMEATIVTLSHFHRSVVANEAFVKTVDFVAVVVGGGDLLSGGKGAAGQL